jgi:subtilisin family serine protease
MADVFLSYRNLEDRRKLVGRLATILRAHGISVWWDYGLEAGESYREQIVKALGEAHVVVPVWCSESVKSQWVAMEAELGRDKLLPVRLQRVAPPAKFEALHATHLEKWDGSILDPQLDEFIRDLCKKLGKVGELPPDTRGELSQLPKLRPLPEIKPPVTATQPGVMSRAAPYAVAALVLATALAAGAWWMTTQVGGTGLTTQTAAANEAGEAVTTDAAIRTPPPGSPNDPLAARQWYLAGPDANGIGALEYSRRTGATGEGVVIAAVDTGIYRPHPDLATANIARGYDLVSDPIMGNDGDGRDDDPTDPGDQCDPGDKSAVDSLHGTFGASLIVSRPNDAVGLIGVAPGARFVPVRSLGRCGGKLSDINDGIRWAAGAAPLRDASGGEIWNTEPANIVVLPLMLFEPCRESMQKAIDDAVAAGAIVVSAAGNARVDTKFFSPGGCNNVIAVGATDRRGHMTPYSNYGRGIDLLAPGGDNARDDDSDGSPDGIIGAKYVQTCHSVTGAAAEACEHSIEIGSSQAAMLVGGALALLKSKHPEESNEALTARLLTATTPRTTMQCSGTCTSYPGAEPVPGLENICFRRCGVGLLDLTKAD